MMQTLRQKEELHKLAPRTLGEHRLPARIDAEPTPGWLSCLASAAIGAVAMWCFLALVLGWPA